MSKKILLKIIDEYWPDFWETARFLHDNPELGGKEFKAVKHLTEKLEKYGFQLTCPYLGLPTAFKAQFGQGKPAIFLLAEYDALPEIGHGCGHNLIAGASLGAAIALVLLKDNWSGTLVVLGTPAEETKGGKVILVERGAFTNCDAALMFHPGQSSIINITSQALEALEVSFSGEYGHSAGKLTTGNPLVSLISFFQEVFNYNNSYYPEQQIQGVIIEGGVTPNLTPQKATGRFYLRAGSLNQLNKGIKSFHKLVQKTAELNNTGFIIKNFEPRYLPMNTNLCLASVFKEQAELLGIKMDTGKYQIIGSMDIGNVSWDVPAIHPYFTLGYGTTIAHTPEFARISGGKEGEETMKKAAKVLALTALELFTRPELIEEAWKKHNLTL